MVEEILLLILGTGIGFLLTAGWDLWKEHRSEREEVQRVKRLLLIELAENRQAALTLEEYVRQSLLALNEGKELGGATWRLSEEAWIIAKNANIQRWLDFNTLKKLMITYLVTRQINMMMTNRETFRVTSRALSNHVELLKNFDSSLIERLGTLIKLTEGVAHVDYGPPSL